MAHVLKQFFDSLDESKVRFVRPRKVVFFCGGAMPNGMPARTSLRHYLISERNIQRLLNADIVRAEAATELFRETTYQDLITFEEDIATLSPVILVIVESAGSFAELGAFASIEKIQDALAVISQQKYEDEESFVRLGPILRIQKSDSSKVAFFPWRTHKNGTVIKSTIDPNFVEIVNFINERIDESPKKTAFKSSKDIKLTVMIIWIVYLAIAIKQTEIKNYLELLGNDVSESDLKKRLLCLRVAGWIKKFTYSNAEYYAVLHDIDPFDYAYIAGSDHNTTNWKTMVGAQLQKDLGSKKRVRQQALHLRKAPST